MKTPHISLAYSITESPKKVSFTIWVPCGLRKDWGLPNGR